MYVQVTLMKRAKTIIGVGLVGYCSSFISIEICCLVAALVKLYLDLRKVPEIRESMDEIGNKTMDILSPIRPVNRKPETSKADASGTSDTTFDLKKSD